MTDEPTTPEDPTVTEEPLLPPSPTAPLPPASPTGRTGLVRDPYSRLGGLASGIAHRYGWDPTLVRLVFVVALLASFGTALIVYLIAWLVVPRATVWPPTPVRAPAGGFSSREAGIGLAIAGVLAFFVTGAGAAGAVLVPLALVGGGIWLLTQEPRSLAAEGAAAAGPAASPASQPLVGTPVPPRSRKRRWLVGGLITAAVLAVVAAVAIPVAVVGYFASGADGGRISIGNDDFRLASYSPTDLDSIPARIISDNGAVRVDLGAVATTMPNDGPTELEIDLGEGEIWLILPDDLTYSLDATADQGRVDTDGAVALRDRDGVGSVQVERADADIAITLHLDEGDIHIDD